jgi:hypothetical protein
VAVCPPAIALATGKSTHQLLERLALYVAAWAPRPGHNGDGTLPNLVVGGDEPASTTDPAIALSR